MKKNCIVAFSTVCWIVLLVSVSMGQPGDMSVQNAEAQASMIISPGDVYSPAEADVLLDELAMPTLSPLEELVKKSSTYEPVEGYATYYAKRFEGRRTTSGYRYHPDKMTAAHVSLPLGTVVRVVNPRTGQDVSVVINDRCAPRSFPLIDLSRAAAKKIGLWGKGKIKVVIIPLLEESLEEPA